MIPFDSACALEMRSGYPLVSANIRRYRVGVVRTCARKWWRRLVALPMPVRSAMVST